MTKVLGKLFRKGGINVETKLIWMVCIFLVILFISNTFIYFNLMLSMYSDQLLKSNERILDQVVIAFESVTKQINDSIYKIPLYDKDLLNWIRNYSSEPFYKREIVRKIDSITLGNEYLASASLYLPRHNILFDAETGNTSSFEYFYDKEALGDYMKGKIYSLDPRLVDNGIQKKLLMTVVCPIPIPSTVAEPEGVLIVYIDARKLYYNILNKIDAQDNMNLFAYNPDNTIVIHKNEESLFKKYSVPAPENAFISKIAASGGLFKKNMKISSIRYSGQLKWNFVLENSVETPVNYLSRIYSFITYFTLILLISLLIIVLIVKYSVKPIKQVMSSYDDNLWKDFLDGGSNTEEIKKLMLYREFNEKTEYCALAVLQITELPYDHRSIQHYIESIDRFCSGDEFITNFKTISMNRNNIAIILHFRKEDLSQNSEAEMLKFLKLLYEGLNPDLKPSAYAAASLFKDSMSLLPMAYMECMESLNYKICSNSNILMYSDLKEKRQWTDYPYDIERQLINNIIVGNEGAAEILMDRFLESLTKSDFRIRDSEFHNCIYQLQASIMRNLSALPLSYRLDFNMDIMQMFDLQKIKEKLLDTVGKMAYQTNKRDENNEYVMYSKVFEYIDANFTSELFNLNKAADDLNLNRNYLARIVKEKTGENFIDYVNEKRVQTAKQLMQNPDESIENITHKVGFNYSHYFIKVFKKIEGITPGQYRERLQNTQTRIRII